jgi:hypothetical protein
MQLVQGFHTHQASHVSATQLCAANPHIDTYTEICTCFDSTVRWCTRSTHWHIHRNLSTLTTANPPRSSNHCGWVKWCRVAQGSNPWAWQQSRIWWNLATASPSTRPGPWGSKRAHCDAKHKVDVADEVIWVLHWMKWREETLVGYTGSRADLARALGLKTCSLWCKHKVDVADEVIEFDTGWNDGKRTWLVTQIPGPTWPGPWGSKRAHCVGKHKVDVADEVIEFDTGWDDGKRSWWVTQIPGLTWPGPWGSKRAHCVGKHKVEVADEVIKFDTGWDDGKRRWWVTQIPGPTWPKPWGSKCAHCVGKRKVDVADEVNEFGTGWDDREETLVGHTNSRADMARALGLKTCSLCWKTQSRSSWWGD